MLADNSTLAHDAPPQPRHLNLSDWQVALLKSIWRHPSLWIDGHRDVDELRRRGLVMLHDRYLFLTEAGLSVVKTVATD